ncbi:hypothetical protein NZA43_26240, partial [Escherichia coli]
SAPAPASTGCWTPRAAMRSARRSCRSTRSSSRTPRSIQTASRPPWTTPAFRQVVGNYGVRTQFRGSQEYTAFAKKAFEDEKKIVQNIGLED